MLQVRTGEQRKSREAQTRRVADLAGRASELRQLSPRIAELLALWLDGATTATAAQTLGIRVNTVKTYTRRLYREFSVHSRTELLHSVTAIVQAAE